MLDVRLITDVRATVSYDTRDIVGNGVGKWLSYYLRHAASRTSDRYNREQDAAGHVAWGDILADCHRKTGGNGASIVHEVATSDKSRFEVWGVFVDGRFSRVFSARAVQGFSPPYLDERRLYFELRVEHAPLFSCLVHATKMHNIAGIMAEGLTPAGDGRKERTESYLSPWHPADERYRAGCRHESPVLVFFEVEKMLAHYELYLTRAGAVLTRRRITWQAVTTICRRTYKADVPPSNDQIIFNANMRDLEVLGTSGGAGNVHAEQWNFQDIDGEHFLCNNCEMRLRPGSLMCTACQAKMVFSEDIPQESVGSSQAGAGAGASSGYTVAGTGVSSGYTVADTGVSSGKAGASTRKFIPAMVAAAQPKQFMTQPMRVEAYGNFSHKQTTWQDLNGRINKLITHRLKWESDAEYRVKCAAEGKTKFCTSSVHADGWGDIRNDPDDIPDVSNYDGNQMKVMKCYDVMAPIKNQGFGHTSAEYLEARETCMKIWHGDDYTAIGSEALRSKQYGGEVAFEKLQASTLAAATAALDMAKPSSAPGMAPLPKYPPGIPSSSYTEPLPKYPPGASSSSYVPTAAWCHKGKGKGKAIAGPPTVDKGKGAGKNTGKSTKGWSKNGPKK